MKRFTKIVVAACLTTLVLFSLSACNKEDEDDKTKDDEAVNVVGTWKKSVNTVEVTSNNYDWYNSYLENVKVTWIITSEGNNNNGSVEIETDSVNFGKSSVTGSWKLEGKKLTIVDKSLPLESQETTYTYNSEDGHFYFDDPSEKYYRFEKQ